jgi:hypothetical protein
VLVRVLVLVLARPTGAPSTTVSTSARSSSRSASLPPQSYCCSQLGSVSALASSKVTRRSAAGASAFSASAILGTTAGPK